MASETYKGYKLSTRKSVVTAQGARGTYRATVYKPLVNGRVVGTLASGFEGGAIALAKKAVDRLG